MLGNIYMNRMKLLISTVDKILLDIGCANGDFPRFMRKIGWQVEGVEISANSKSISDFKVYKEDFSQIQRDRPALLTLCKQHGGRQSYSLSTYSRSTGPERTRK